MDVIINGMVLNRRKVFKILHEILLQNNIRQENEDSCEFYWAAELPTGDYPMFIPQTLEQLENMGFPKWFIPIAMFTGIIIPSIDDKYEVDLELLEIAREYELLDPLPPITLEEAYNNMEEAYRGLLEKSPADLG